MSGGERQRSSRESLRVRLRDFPSDEPVDCPSVSQLPAFECFASHISESSASSKFEDDVRPGDTLIVKVKKFDVVGAYVKPICFATRIKRDLEWLDIQLIAPLSALSPRLSIGAYLLCSVTAVKPCKIEIIEAAPLDTKSLPAYFRNGRDLPNRTSLRNFLEDRKEVRNPYYDSVLGFSTRSSRSFLDISDLKKDRHETASMMRGKQDEELALESVARGVEEMKSGNRAGAIQQFNHALSICPLSVDALVARGAALSNEGHYVKAEEDFEKALSVQDDHTNAKTYLVETLIKHATLVDLQGDMARARTLYQKALRLKDDKRARAAIEKMDSRKKRKRRSPSVEIVELDAPTKQRRSEGASSSSTQSKIDKAKIAQEKKKLQEMEAFINALKKGK